MVFEADVGVRQKTRILRFDKWHLTNFRRNGRFSSKTTYVPFLKNGTYEVLEVNRRFEENKALNIPDSGLTLTVFRIPKAPKENLKLK